MLFLLFLAVTSAVSTEQVAVSNILTYDIYATYINKNPTEKQILWISRVTIVMYCFVMGGIATGKCLLRRTSNPADLRQHSTTSVYRWGTYMS